MREINQENNIDFTVSEIFISVSWLKNSKDSVSEATRNEHLEKEPLILIEFICNFLNLFVNTGHVRDIWRHS